MIELIEKLTNWFFFNIIVAMFPLGFNALQIYKSLPKRQKNSQKYTINTKKYPKREINSQKPIMSTEANALELNALELALGNGELFLLTVAVNSEAIGGLVSVSPEDKIIRISKLIGVGFCLLLILLSTALFYKRYDQNNTYSRSKQAIQKNTIDKNNLDALNALNELLSHTKNNHQDDEDIRNTSRDSISLFLISFVLSGLCKIVEFFN